MTEYITRWQAAVGMVLVCGAVYVYVMHTSPSPFLAVHFLDIGQGDAVFIQTPDGYEVLVDGGATSVIARELASQQAPFDRHIDIVIATHPDTDHVGGLVDVLERYQVDMILETEAQGASDAALAYVTFAAAEGAVIKQARAGQIIQVGASTTIEILAPASDTTNWRANNASIIMRLVYGETAFLLTGDAPSSIEDYVAKSRGASLVSNVLKLGHHGSKTSTSDFFLDTVQPQYAVVSAGLDNRYGHPHQSVLSRVFERDITTFHTGVDGTVSFYSDGEKVWWE